MSSSGSEEESDDEVIRSRSSSVESSSDSVIEAVKGVELTPDVIEELYSGDKVRPEYDDPIAKLWRDVKAAEKPAIVEPDRCANCGAQANKGKVKSLNFKCTWCKVPKYCSKNCCTFHFDSRHKRECPGRK